MRKNKTFQFRTSVNILGFLDRLKPRFNVNSSAKVIEALVTKEMGFDEFEDEQYLLTDDYKFEILIKKLDAGGDITQGELLFFLYQLGKLWGKSNKYFYNNKYFHILLRDYIKIIQENGLSLVHFTSIFWKYTNLSYKDLIEFYELSLRQDLNGLGIISEFVEYFIFYAKKCFERIDFNKYLDKQNILTLAKFIYFRELKPDFDCFDDYKISEEKLVLLDENMKNNWKGMETHLFYLEYQISPKNTELSFKLYFKSNHLTLKLPINIWKKFINGLLNNGNGLGLNFLQTNKFFLEQYVTINVDIKELQSFITQAISSDSYLKLFNGYINIAGDI